MSDIKEIIEKMKALNKSYLGAEGFSMSVLISDIEAELSKQSDDSNSSGEIRHWSDCAVHNMPASPNGPCDCGGYKEDPQ